MSYLQHSNVNNLYEWAMSQKLPVNNLKWVKDIFKFDESFIKKEEAYFFEVDVQYLEELHDLHNVLSFLPERIKIVKKVVANLYDKTEYVMHIRNLKQSLNH